MDVPFFLKNVIITARHYAESAVFVTTCRHQIRISGKSADGSLL